MKRLFIILFCLFQGFLLNGMDQHRANRYSSKTEWLMGILSSSNSLRSFARSQRVISQTTPNRWTQLFMDAQRSVGVPDQDLLLVRLGARNEKYFEAIALTDMGEIVVMPHNFDDLKYGAQRITALHEAFHHKYHDASLHPWLLFQLMKANCISTGLMTLAGWGITYTKCISPWKYLVYAGVPLGSWVASTAMFLGLARYVGLLDSFPSAIDDYVEFRADRNAVEVAQCAQCVKEYANVSAENTHYLTRDELDKYRAYYEEHKKYCDNHRSGNK